MKRTLITNIGMLATPQGTSARGGRAQGEICILKNAWIFIENDVIAQVGTGTAPAAVGVQIINAGGKLVTPGLVDAHTHLIFGGWRQNELAPAVRCGLSGHPRRRRRHPVHHACHKGGKRGTAGGKKPPPRWMKCFASARRPQRPRAATACQPRRSARRCA